jgi:hypothetical protein
VVPLTALECDILADMAGDSHFTGEILGFVRSCHALDDEFELYRRTYGLLESWIGRGWLETVETPRRQSSVKTIADLLPYLDMHGVDAFTEERLGELPELGLTRQAFVDVEWLQGAV